MTNEQILKKAIEKAVKGGFNPIDDMGEIDNFDIYRTNNYWEGIWISFHTKHGDSGLYDIVRLLFGLKHSFAKAFWGEGI